VLLLERKRRKVVEEVSKNNRAANPALLSPDLWASEGVQYSLKNNYTLLYHILKHRLKSIVKVPKTESHLCMRLITCRGPTNSNFRSIFVANRSFGKPTPPGVLALPGTVTISTLHRNFCPAIFLPHAARLTRSFLPAFLFHISLQKFYSSHIPQNKSLYNLFSMMFCRFSLKGALITCYCLPRPIMVTL
jgi:hypothetical protein